MPTELDDLVSSVSLDHRKLTVHIDNIRAPAVGLVWYQMTVHVDFELAQILISPNIVLLLVGLHALLKAIVN